MPMQKASRRRCQPQFQRRPFRQPPSQILKKRQRLLPTPTTSLSNAAAPKSTRQSAATTATPTTTDAWQDAETLTSSTRKTASDRKSPPRQHQDPRARPLPRQTAAQRRLRPPRHPRLQHRRQATTRATGHSSPIQALPRLTLQQTALPHSSSTEIPTLRLRPQDTPATA